MQGFFVQQSQSNKNKWISPWLFALSRAECCSGFLSGNCMLKSCIFQRLEAAGRVSVRCSLACHPPWGAFFVGLQLFWCGINTGSASPSKTPWADALRHHMLLVPGYWCWNCGCSLLCGSEFLNWAATAVLMLLMWEIVSEAAEVVCKGVLNLWFQGGLSRQVTSTSTPEVTS